MFDTMKKLAAPLEAPAWAAVRIVSGLAFSFHGMQKIFGLMAKHATEVGGQIWFGGLIELTCGLLIAFGLLTRPAAFLASGTMAVAYIQFHWKLEFAEGKWLPAINNGELALIYCFLFLFVCARGGGLASLDRRFEKSS